MKIKTSELNDIALDWAVAKCEEPSGRDNAEQFLRDHRIGFSTRYSTNWSQGGPIIERENIDVHAPRPVWPHWKAYKPEWNGGSGLMEGNVQYGPTLLIAAMRCYCCARRGSAYVESLDGTLPFSYRSYLDMCWACGRMGINPAPLRAKTR